MSTTPVRLTPKVGDATDTQRWLAEARQTAHTDTISGKHRDPRTTWCVPLEVHVCLGRGCTQTYYATACDISEGGIGFLVREAIQPYTRVLVCRAGEMVAVPVVTVTCTQTLTGHIIGAEFRFEDQVPSEQAVAKAG